MRRRQGGKLVGAVGNQGEGLCSWSTGRRRRGASALENIHVISLLLRQLRRGREKGRE